ncbi:hypothetical protein FA95DRAFT_941290 [Auriscalpium vulgare]|uniref:Uncharacterized protein n=1 Tax=Auriscalpium vulgare TaxID=40419 RepID=A0ACB8SAQ9_9AGAM|nr:hypothetical protein FA95DRAFT_941290 [Auriscalpium vulgare]
MGKRKKKSSCSQFTAHSTRMCDVCNRSIHIAFGGEGNWQQHLNSASHRAAASSMTITQFFTKVPKPSQPHETFVDTRVSAPLVPVTALAGVASAASRNDLKAFRDDAADANNNAHIPHDAGLAERDSRDRSYAKDTGLEDFEENTSREPDLPTQAVEEGKLHDPSIVFMTARTPW